MFQGNKFTPRNPIEALLKSHMNGDQMAAQLTALQAQLAQVQLDLQAQQAALKVREQQLAAKEEAYEIRLAEEVAKQVIATLREIEEQKRLARYQQFGPSSETSYCLFNEVELEAAQSEAGAGEGPEDGDTEETEVVTTRKKKRAAGRGRRTSLPSELPRIDEIIDVPEEKRFDAHGNPMVAIGQEISESLDIRPMQIYVRRTIRIKYAPVNGDSSPIIAPVPPTLLPRGIYSPGFMAMVLTTKYVDGLPLNRFTKVMARSNIKISSQSLARNVIRVAERMKPLTDLLRDTLLEGPAIYMDETPVQVINEPGRKASTQSYMWVQRGGPPGKTAILFDYAPSRAGKVAMELIDGWAGLLMTDGYSGYNQLGKTPGMVHLACMAHARRNFVKALAGAPGGKSPSAVQALDYFSQLYAIERDLREASLEERLRVRQEKSKPILEAMRAWVDVVHSKFPPKSLLGKAFAYLDKLWVRLTLYVDHPMIDIDNNGVENNIRPFAIGRRNWLFSYSPEGAEASARIYSLVETAKANGCDPYAWLVYVLEQLPYAQTREQLEALLPWNCSLETLAMNLVARDEEFNRTAAAHAASA